jgi:hypothetical protein
MRLQTGAWGIVALALVLLTSPARADSPEPPASAPTEPASASPAQPASASPAQPASASPAQPASASPAQPAPASPAQPASASPAQPASVPPTPPPHRRPLYKSGWLWGAAGALVVIVVAGVVAARVSAEWANAPDAGPGRTGAALAVRW